MEIPKLRRLDLPREKNQNIIDHYLTNPHYCEFFYKSLNKLKQTSSVNEINNYDVNLNSDEDEYIPAKILDNRIDFEHHKLPHRMMKLQSNDDYNFTVGEACIASTEETLNKGIHILSNESFVLGPGDEISIPVRLLN